MPGRMKFVPTVVHNLPHPGYRFERWSSLPFAEVLLLSILVPAGWMAEQWIDESRASNPRPHVPGASHSTTGDCESSGRRMHQCADRMRQGARLSILARLVLRAADRARGWCVTIAGIAQIALFRLIPPYSTALFGSPSNFGVAPKNHTAPRPCPRESIMPSLFK